MLALQASAQVIGVERRPGMIQIQDKELREVSIHEGLGDIEFGCSSIFAWLNYNGIDEFSNAVPTGESC